MLFSLLITHDLAAAATIADHVAVIMRGAVECGPAGTLRGAASLYRGAAAPHPPSGGEAATACEAGRLAIAAAPRLRLSPALPAILAECREEPPALLAAGDGCRLVACHRTGVPGGGAAEAAAGSP